MHPGSRAPIFIILGLAVVCSVLAINYWTTTGQRNQLEEDLSLLQKKYNLLLSETKGLAYFNASSEKEKSF
jgi:hypothetical protein